MKTVLTIDDIFDQIEAKSTWQLHADERSKPSGNDAAMDGRIKDALARVGG